MRSITEAPAPSPPSSRRGSSRGAGSTGRALLALAALLAGAVPASAQRVISSPDAAIIVIKGQAALIVQPTALQRLSIADPEVAEVFAISPREVMINGKELGSTSLLLWDASGGRRLYTVDVMPDTASLRQTVRQLYPDEAVSILTNGATVIATGTVSSAQVGQRIVQIAEAAGFKVVNNLQAPAVPQVMLQVRFAEVSRSAMQELGTQLSAVSFGGDRPGAQSASVESSSAGLLKLSLLSPEVELNATIDAMKSRGQFRSLAEPNLLARDGEEASFLAGGEFPFPVAQGGTSNMVTVVWKEFGVRLRFRPTVLPSGIVRLKIAPEVSSLDFSGSLRVAGFQIPSLLTRRAETEVELLPGQHLAIAGLLDNSLERNVRRIPFLGDIPIIGELFRSRDVRESRTELLVIVSPRLVTPSDEPMPLPAGEPGGWGWSGDMGGNEAPADGAAR